MLMVTRFRLAVLFCIAVICVLGLIFGKGGAVDIVRGTPTHHTTQLSKADISIAPKPLCPYEPPHPDNWRARIDAITEQKHSANTCARSSAATTQVADT